MSPKVRQKHRPQRQTANSYFYPTMETFSVPLSQNYANHCVVVNVTALQFIFPTAILAANDMSYNVFSVSERFCSIVCEQRSNMLAGDQRSRGKDKSACFGYEKWWQMKLQLKGRDDHILPQLTMATYQPVCLKLITGRAHNWDQFASPIFSSTKSLSD